MKDQNSKLWNSSSRFYCQNTKGREVESDEQSEMQSFQTSIEDEENSPSEQSSSEEEEEEKQMTVRSTLGRVF